MLRYLKVVAVLIPAFFGFTPSLKAQCTPTSDCVISPAKVEVNIGALPVDYYWSTNNGTIPTCDADAKVKDCIRTMLSSYRNQGATGVRFLFGLGGGGHSTPFAPDGGVYSCWMDRLNDFLADVKYYGYTSVTPTPVLVDSWSAVEGSPYYSDQTGVVSCAAQTGKSLRFVRWLPFGLDPNKDFFPDCQGEDNRGYNTAANNTYNFWGWDKYFKLLNRVFQKVALNNLTIGDFDMQNEVDLLNFTVLGRLIYDNKNSVDVLDGVRQKMDANFPGTGAWSRVTFSTQMKRPSFDLNDPNFDCPSVYGDSAMIVFQSELQAAFAGGLIGMPTGVSQPRNLPCGGSGTGMFTFPTNYYQNMPTVTNIHAHVCFVQGGINNPNADRCVIDPDPQQVPDATPVAKALYSDVWAYLQYRQITTNKLMFGEVNHTQSGNLGVPATADCLAYYTVDRAYNNVNGFLQSTLYTDPNAANTLANTVLRVWEDMQRSCYTVPNQINRPYRPQ